MLPSLTSPAEGGKAGTKILIIRPHVLTCSDSLSLKDIISRPTSALLIFLLLVHLSIIHSQAYF